MVVRQAEVLRDSSINRFASYIVPNNTAMKELQEGFDLEDDDKMIDAISRMSSEDFIQPLLKLYSPAIKELTKKILDTNTRFLDDIHQKSAKVGLFKPSIKPIQQRTHHTFIKQRTIKDGKDYERTKPEKFTNKQMTFLITHQGYKNKDLVKAYNDYFPGEKRTESSIITHKYRIKKRKLTPKKWRDSRMRKKKNEDDKKLKKFNR